MGRRADEKREASGARRTRYLVVVEETQAGYSAHCPDVDGCVATGRTRVEVEEQIGRVLEFHLCGLWHREGGVPKPKAYARYVDTGPVLRVARR
jgi:predicted RNase H-like HicB family nuclease